MLKTNGLRALFFVLLFPALSVVASEELYLPTDVTYDSKIPRPEAVLGYEVGDWHVRPEQISQYIGLLAELSPRMKLEIIGYTHEQRPLMLLAVSSPKNIRNVEDIRRHHLSRIEQGNLGNSGPVVIWSGYSVHGNEASGSNASLLVAYYLAAAQGPQVDKLLKNSVILIDPMLNPDGLARFASWTNSHKGATLVADDQNREHNQSWPSGRTNHYWFDLNRDWLLQVHPESRARVKAYYRWRPNVLTDHHEMGSNSSFFFQPGIPSRQNPLTPKENLDLTRMLANYHAGILDKNNQLYFTEERFDDFYYGKGSTYPDINGTIGILFEQASAAGHLIETESGDLSFKKAIRNQFLASMSTFEGALENRTTLLSYQQRFYQEAKKEAQEDELAGFLLHEDKDSHRLFALLSLLKKHQILAYPISKDYEKDGTSYNKRHSYFVPLEQAQYRLIKAMFSTATSFPDNTFYDVSAWNLAYAHNIDFVPVSKSLWQNISMESDAWIPRHPVQKSALTPAYAHAFSWETSEAPKLLTQILSKNIKARISTKAFVAKTSHGNRAMSEGAVIISAADQTNADYLMILDKIFSGSDVEVLEISSGLTPQGIDLGSGNMAFLSKPEIGVIVGAGMSQYEVGEAWHYLDKQLGVPVSLLDNRYLGQLDLNRYTHLIMVDGNYSSLKTHKKTLSAWLSQGGTLIAQKRASQWLAAEELLRVKFIDSKDLSEPYSTEGLVYADREKLRARKRIAGAIFETQVDATHPLMFGISQDILPIFKNSNAVMQPIKDPFVTVASYTKEPLLAGFASAENVGLVESSAAIAAHSVGRGRIIAFVDNPNFRGFWKGTERLLSNAIYLSSAINVRPGGD